jgi:hypothetical protein
MATKITVVLEDDLDGGPADEIVRFAIGSTDYEIDLNANNAAARPRSMVPQACSVLTRATATL